jgi:hypothetical protein
MEKEGIPPGRALATETICERRVCVHIKHILKLTIGVEQLQPVLDAVVGFLTLNLLKSEKSNG